MTPASLPSSKGRGPDKREKAGSPAKKCADAWGSSKSADASGFRSRRPNLLFDRSVGDGRFGQLDDLVHLEDVGAGEHLFGGPVAVSGLEVLALRPAHEIFRALPVGQDDVIFRSAHLAPVD